MLTISLIPLHKLHNHTRWRLRPATLLRRRRHSSLDNILPNLGTQLPRHSTTLTIPITPHLRRHPNPLLRKHHALLPIVISQIPLQPQHNHWNTFIIIEVGLDYMFPFRG